MDPSTRKIISELIGKAAATIFGSNHDEGEWRFIRSSILRVQSNHSMDMAVNCYSILQSLVEISPSSFEQISKFVKQGLTHYDCKHKIGAIRVLQCYLKSEKMIKVNKFYYLASGVYEAAYTLLMREDDILGLQALRSMVDLNCEFFSNDCMGLAKLTKLTLENTSRQDAKTIIIQCLLEVLVVCSSEFVKKNLIFKEIIEKLVYRMTEISRYITDEWMHIQEVVDNLQDDQAQFKLRKATQSIDRTIEFVGVKQILPFLTNLVYELIQSENWREKFAALMTVSQMGEYVEDVSEIPIDANTIISFLRSETPQIRYAACHAIGQLCSDTKTMFQRGDGKSAFSELITIVKNDPVPRVVSYAIAAMTNFAEGIPFAYIQQQTGELIPLLLNFIANGSSAIKFHSFSLISTITQTASWQYVPYLEQTLPVLFAVYSKPSRNQKAWRQHKLIGLETLTIIAEYLDKKLYPLFLNQAIQIILSVQQSISENPTRSEMEYIFSSWQRLCMIFPDQLKPCIKDFLPTLLLFAQRLIEMSKSIKYKKSTLQIEGCLEAVHVFLRMFQVIVGVKEEIIPFLQKAFQITYKLLKIGGDRDIIRTSCSCISTIISYNYVDSLESLQIVKQIAKSLLNEINNFTEWEIVPSCIQTLLNVCSIPNLFNQAQLQDFLNGWGKSLQSIDECQANKIDMEDQPILIKFVQQTIQKSSYLISTLFKAHRILIIEIAEEIIANVLPKIFKQGQIEKTLLFGLYLVDAMIQICEYPLLKNNWESFAQLLLHFSQSKSFMLKGAACRAIGTLIEKTPNALMNQQTIKNWFDFFLEENRILSQDQENTPDRRYYQQTMIEAVGTMLGAHHFAFELKEYVQDWLNNLPLRNTYSRLNQQIQILADITINHKQLILGNNEVENFKTILSIYANAIRFNDSNQPLFSKIRYCLMDLQLDASLNKSLSHAWREIRPRNRSTIIDFMNQA